MLEQGTLAQALDLLWIFEMLWSQIVMSKILLGRSNSPTLFIYPKIMFNFLWFGKWIFFERKVFQGYFWRPVFWYSFGMTFLFTFYSYFGMEFFEWIFTYEFWISFPLFTCFLWKFEFEICFCLITLPSKVALNNGEDIFRRQLLLFSDVSTLVKANFSHFFTKSHLLTEISWLFELIGKEGHLRMLTRANILWFLIVVLRTVCDSLLLDFSWNLENCLDLVCFSNAFLDSTFNKQYPSCSTIMSS